MISVDPPVEAATAISVARLRKAYALPQGKQLSVLNDISFEVKRGECIAILGPSGAGKTTLLSLLGALERPDGGEIWLDGLPVHRLRGRAAARFRRQHIGFIFQSFYLLPTLTAWENVTAPLLPFQHEVDFDPRQRARALLAQVGLEQRLHHFPAQLSGGEQQRVAIARSLLNHPPVLLADEPTGNLDPATGQTILALLQAQQRAEGCTLVLVTHNPTVAAAADRRIRLRTAERGLEVEHVEEYVGTPGAVIPTPDYAGDARRRTRHGVSRRIVLIGSLTFAGVAAVGGTIWLAKQSSSLPVTTSPSSLGKTLVVYQGHHSNISAVAWSPDGTSIASGAASLPGLRWIQATDQQRQAAIMDSEMGRADATVQIWDPRTGQRRLIYQGHRGGVGALAWSPNSTRMASCGLADASTQVWNPVNGQRLSMRSNGTGERQGALAAIWALAWSPGGTYLAIGDALHRVQVWKVATGQTVVTYTRHRGPINCLAWSPDGGQLASASSDGTVQVWDALTGQQQVVYTDQTGPKRAVLWSADGQSVVSAGSDGSIKVWQANNGNVFWLYTGHTRAVNALAWSPDTSLLASGSDDTAVYLWQNWNSNATTPLYQYRAHTAAVLAVSWSADSTQVASGSADQTVRVWLASFASP